MQKIIQQFLLILFVFLQCLSPLAHAHVDGHNADHSLHSHELSVYVQMLESHVENDEGAVITMPHAYPASDSPTVSDPSVELATSLYRVDHEPRLPAVFSALFNAPLTASCYASAWSQAPPAITHLA